MEHPNYVNRAQWGARPPTAVTPMEGPNLTYVHHTAGNESGSAGMRSIQNYHMDVRKFRDIAYSWVIDSDGLIYQGRGWLVTHGANLGADNSTSHSICFMGNFQIEQPTQVALDSFVALVQYGKSAGYLTGVLAGHRDEADAETACPGDKLYAKLPELRSLVNSSVPPPVVAPSTGDDMYPYMVQNSDSGAVLLVMGESTTILVTSTSDLKAHQGAGFKTLKVTANQFSRYETLRKA